MVATIFSFDLFVVISRPNKLSTSFVFVVLFSWPQVGENFFPCELPEEACSLLQEAVTACAKDDSLLADSNGDQVGKMSRETLEKLVSAACEAGPVEGGGIESVREAAVAIKECFRGALKEEKEKVRVCDTYRRTNNVKGCHRVSDKRTRKNIALHVVKN